MFHAGLALELSRIFWDDRRVKARRGRGRSERGRSGPTSPRMRQERPRVGSRMTAVPNITDEDPWRPWRVVEPDAAYLRRRAA